MQYWNVIQQFTIRFFCVIPILDTALASCQLLSALDGSRNLQMLNEKEASSPKTYHFRIYVRLLLKVSLKRQSDPYRTCRNRRYVLMHTAYAGIYICSRISYSVVLCCASGNSMMLANIDFRWVPTEALAKSVEDRLRILRLCQRLTAKRELPTRPTLVFRVTNLLKIPDESFSLLKAWTFYHFKSLFIAVKQLYTQ